MLHLWTLLLLASAALRGVLNGRALKSKKNEEVAVMILTCILICFARHHYYFCCVSYWR